MNKLEIIKHEMSILKSYPGYESIINAAEQLDDENKSMAVSIKLKDEVLIKQIEYIKFLEAETERLKVAITASGFLYDADGDLQEALMECAISNDSLRKELQKLKQQFGRGF